MPVPCTRVRTHACPRRDPHIRSAGRGGALGPRYSPAETIVLATRTRVGWGAGQPLRRGRVLGVGDPRWEGRSPHSSTPELTVGRAALGTVGEHPCGQQCDLDLLRRAGPRSRAGRGRGAGPSRWRGAPRIHRSVFGGPGLRSRPAPTPSAAFSLPPPVTVCPDADPLPVHPSCRPGAPIPFRASAGGRAGSLRKPPAPQARL